MAEKPMDFFSLLEELNQKEKEESEAKYKAALKTKSKEDLIKDLQEAFEAKIQALKDGEAKVAHFLNSSK